MSTLDNRHEAAVPDTLDLAERAGLAVNALTGSADPERNYESYLCAHMDNRPAYFSHGAGGACMPKPVQALPMMRVMSGSELRAGHDRKMLESGLQMIEDDGLPTLEDEKKQKKRPMRKRKPARKRKADRRGHRRPNSILIFPEAT